MRQRNKSDNTTKTETKKEVQNQPSKSEENNAWNYITMFNDVIASQKDLYDLVKGLFSETPSDTWKQLGDKAVDFIKEAITKPGSAAGKMIRKVDLPFVSDLISAIDHGIKAYEDFTQDIPDLLGGIYNSGAALFDIGSNALPAKTIFKLGKLLYGFFDIGYGMYQDRAEQLK